MATSTEKVTYQVINNAKYTQGGIRFENEIGQEYTKQVMDAATVFIWWLFQQRAWEETKEITNVKLIIIENMNISADVRGSEIYISARYIAGFQGDLMRDFTGLIYFCMAQVWQWQGKGQAPPGLLNGIADYVRLKADFPVTNWPSPGAGKSWDEGCAVTAHFLNFCKRANDNFIIDLNKKLRSGYSPQFFKELVNKPVVSLWQEFKRENGY